MKDMIHRIIFPTHPHPHFPFLRCRHSSAESWCLFRRQTVYSSFPTRCPTRFARVAELSHFRHSSFRTLSLHYSSFLFVVTSVSVDRMKSSSCSDWGASHWLLIIVSWENNSKRHVFLIFLSLRRLIARMGSWCGTATRARRLQYKWSICAVLHFMCHCYRIFLRLT